MQQRAGAGQRLGRRERGWRGGFKILFMHPLILEAGRFGPVCARAAIQAITLVTVLATVLVAVPATTARAATAPTAVTSACPAPQAAVQEFFLPADCADCWAAAAAAAPGAWRFDCRRVQRAHHGHTLGRHR